jgi:hypothetical protein
MAGLNISLAGQVNRVAKCSRRRDEETYSKYAGDIRIKRYPNSRRHKQVQKLKCKVQNCRRKTVFIDTEGGRRT